MNDWDGKKVAIVGGAALLAIAFVNGVYQAGVEAGLGYSGRGDVSHYGHGGGIWPLLILGGILFFVGSRRGWFGKNGGPGRGPGGGAPHFFEDWHRRAHEAEYRQSASRNGGAATPAAPPVMPSAPTGGHQPPMV